MGSVLAELEQVRAEGRRRLEAKERELQNVQNALAASEGERQTASTRVAVVEAELGQLEARVRSCEEARWRAGMDLANAKAELEWRAKADQERDLFAQGMKEELERVKGKLMRSEMRKLKLEESLEEALLELRGRKREIEQVEARRSEVPRGSALILKQMPAAGQGPRRLPRAPAAGIGRAVGSMGSVLCG